MSQQNPTADSIWFEGRAGKFARLAILFGVLIHLAGFMVFRVITEPKFEPYEPTSHVSVSPSSQAAEALVAMAALADSEPLFLPTRWNASVTHRNDPVSSNNTSPFDTFPPEIVLSEAAFDESGTPIGALPRQPEDALLLDPGAVFFSFGRDRSLTAVVPDTAPRIEVYDFDTGELETKTTITPEALLTPLPPSWRFGEFQITFDTTGLLGKPLLNVSTDQEALDKALSAYLLQWFSDNPLPAGNYRVIVGP